MADRPRQPRADHFFKVGDLVRYTYDHKGERIPKLGSRGIVTEVVPRDTGTTYRILWHDGGGETSGYFATVLEPV